MTPRVLAALLVSIVFAADATPGQGQTRTGGLFGATRSDTRTDDFFNVTFGMSEAYDTDVPAEFRGQASQRGPQNGGFSTMLTASLDYANRGRRGALTSNAQTAFRYYQAASDVSSVSHSAAIGGRLELSGSSSLSLQQTAAYSPSYFYQLFPGLAPPELGDAITTAPELRVDQTDSYSYRTSAEFRIGSIRRNRFTTSAEYARTDYEQRTAFSRSDLETRTFGVEYSRGVSRNGRLSGGYDYRTGEFGFGPAVEHRVTFGGNFSKALGSSRRATFRFRLGPSAVDVSETSLFPSAAGYLYRLHAEGSFDYQFRRTWHVGASYRRSVEYVPLLLVPVFADSARAEIAGLVTRRIDISGHAGLATGGSARRRQTRQLDTYTGNARLRFALSRSFALYSEYLYYFYDLHGQLEPVSGLPPRFDQHSIRVGGMIWMSVF